MEQENNTSPKDSPAVVANALLPDAAVFVEKMTNELDVEMTKMRAKIRWLKDHNLNREAKFVREIHDSFEVIRNKFTEFAHYPERVNEISLSEWEYIT